MTASDRKLIPINEIVSRFKISKATIHRKTKSGLFTKYSLPGSRKVYMDENEIHDAFQPKLN